MSMSLSLIVFLSLNLVRRNEGFCRTLDFEIDKSLHSCGQNNKLFITPKDHKDNLANHPTCRLINPAKSELGKVIKQILDNINSKIKKITKLNQRKNTSDVINWFTNIPDMQKHSFASFDIDSFYPSITKSLLSNFICQELYHNQRQRHRHNYVLPEITFIWQRDRLDQEQPSAAFSTFSTSTPIPTICLK